MFTSNPRLTASAAVIALQSLSLWGLAIWSGFLLLTAEPQSLVSALFLIGMLLAAGLWSSNIVIGLFGRKPWAHTPAMILQLLVASIGVASFAGEFGNALIGAILLLPAGLSFYFLFSKPVRSEFGRA
ncbi:hypothetical protein HRU87_05345 [Aquiluna borgnonia]|uniref:Uncharacterized protein n=1 Tax=Aquiluna borgnonia TaxID=2499157 RepID=A0A7D4TUM5_9MICO|nr:hypothetical protein [Aquiluna borgnonia]QKJ25595.1 hypothetical protein HRU87_05345 [Aquiluna borgnonia]